MNALLHRRRRATKDLPRAPCRKRLRDLGKEPLGHATADADIDRGRARRIEIGAEDLVPKHEVLTVIGISLRKQPRVMPAMQARRAQHPVQRPCPDVEIAVGQKT